MNLGKDGRVTGRRKGTGSNSVYEDLRARILTLELPPGSHLDEAALVETYGVSRTPVREALIRLGSGGLLVLLPNRGARVASIDLGNLREFFEALDICQRAATHWAAMRRSSEDLDRISQARLDFESAVTARSADRMNDANFTFHQAIGRASGNSYIGRAYERLLDEGLRVSRMCLSYESNEGASLNEHLERIIDEHRRMEALIRLGDSGAAERIAGAHVVLFRNRVTASLSASLAPNIAVDVGAAREPEAPMKAPPDPQR